MIGRHIYYDWLSDLRGKTFDVWAHKADVDFISTPDTELDGVKLYTWSCVKDGIELSRIKQGVAKVERPLVWLALIGLPNALEYLITLPHSICSTIWYFCHYNKERYDLVDLKKSRYSWYDVSWKVERALEVMFLDFVDNECGGLDGEHHGLIFQSKCKEYSKERRQQLRDLIAAYHFFKTELPALEKEIDDLYAVEKINLVGFAADERFKKFKKLDDKKELLREKHLNAIWNGRQLLWT